MSKKKEINPNFLDDVITDATEDQSAPKVLSSKITTDDKVHNWEQVNIRVREGFKKEFRTWCLRHDMTMGEALTEAHELLKARHGA